MFDHTYGLTAFGTYYADARDNLAHSASHVSFPTRQSLATRLAHILSATKSGHFGNALAPQLYSTISPLPHQLSCWMVQLQGLVAAFYETSMNPFVTILRSTIDQLPVKTGEARARAYSRARDAVMRRLQMSDPIPSDDEIQTQIAKLIEAINEIEDTFLSQPI